MSMITQGSYSDKILVVDDSPDNVFLIKTIGLRFDF